MLEIWQSVFAFVLGCSVGSFLNVVAGRYGSEQSWVRDRSACPHCYHVLHWYELIPLFSFLLQRGRCRHCQAVISVRYPLFEIITGLLFVLLAVPLAAAPLGIARQLLVLIIVSLLLVLGSIDLRTFLLPDLYVALLAGVVALLIATDASGWNVQPLIGAAIGSGFLLFLWLVTRGRGIGLGDVKLMVPLGLLFGGLGTVALLFIAFCSGGLLGVILLARGKAALKTPIPFGPFLVGAGLLLLIYPSLPTYFLSQLFL